MAKGKTLLKISGVLFLISGVFSIIIGAGLDGIFLSSDGAAATKAELVGIVTAMYIICGLVSIIAGFFAIKFANVPEKANFLMICGAATLVIAIVTAIMNMVGSGASLGHMVLGAVSAVVLSVLYLVGAFMNKAK